MGVELDVRSPAFRANPYPFYARLRAEEPVSLQQERGVRLWLLTRWADVTAVLRHPRASVDRPFQPRPTPLPPGIRAETLHPLARALRALSRVMLFRDPPDHTRLRGLVNKAFTPRVVERLRTRIETVVDELVEARADDGGMDLIRDLATPLPILVIAELLGIPVEDYKELKRWSDDLALMLDGSIAAQVAPRAVTSACEFVDYLRGVMAQRRARPRDDLLSELLAVQEKDDALTEDEILGTSVLLLGAGHETTTNLIGNGILALLHHPNELARLRREPERLANTVEECLRFDSPVQATSRVLPEDIEVGGRRIPRGEEIVLLLGAANRDPAVFPDPDRFDVGREEARQHLSFGHGIHFCLGANLARAEAQLAMAGLLRRFPALGLAREALEWRPGFLFRGVEHLALRF
ncbi:MAG TPA: cytochrome P450 [Myxococcota bacterium]|nr:cytochrome P450 [Myxococcota bacterium]